MIGSIPPPFSELGTIGRRGSGARRVGIGLAVALVGGLAVATLASGSSDHTPHPAQVPASQIDPAHPTATPTPTATATPTATPTTAPKYKPLHKARKRPGTIASPNPTQEAPVRLPVSGL